MYHRVQLRHLSTCLSRCCSDWQVVPSLLILTRAYGCCSWVIEWLQFRVCVCVCWSFSLLVSERAGRYSMNDWYHNEREREREIISGNITLSLELWEQKGGGQHYPLKIDVRVCLNTNDRERLMLIVLCFWLSLQLLHVDLIIIIKRTLFFQHTNNKLIVKHNIINFNIHLLAPTTNTTQLK